MSFYERLLNLCKQKNVVLTPLLKKLNISTGATGRWKDGQTPGGEILIKLADALDCSVDYLLGRVDSPELLIKKASPADEDDLQIAVDKDSDLPPLTGEEITMLRELLRQTEKISRSNERRIIEK